MSADLAASVDRLLSIEEIRMLRARYAHHFDMAETGEMAMLFAEDAICSFGPAFGGDWVGRDAIRRNYEGFVARRPVARFAMQHLATNAWIEFDGPDHARGRWYFTVVKTSQVDQPAYVHMGGRYDDHYVRRGGSWLIQHSFVELLAPAPA